MTHAQVENDIKIVLANALAAGIIRGYLSYVKICKRDGFLVDEIMLIITDGYTRDIKNEVFFKLTKKHIQEGLTQEEWKEAIKNILNFYNGEKPCQQTLIPQERYNQSL